ncbi:MAG: 1-(5-phosphoribosyl)-5-[(5-phosphoribosylamino)methylideneamino]imidazole-4-carboxamide isomerase [Candidatus Marinimicrobia bacterium]|nr:1-(5-phosphoribosyl)-5-[(5-phosphoribosylamino)methylideneamino]imidazole-4-carboxamide isomerase [Candidatus Neomarinimicrobiota bacterium]
MITIIPAIDIIDGKCVRLSKGNFDTKKVYNENPLAVAKQFQDNGVRRLHLVDLDGARARKIINWKVLEQIAADTDLIIDFGGGVQSDNDLRIAFESGAALITAGSISVKKPEVVQEWLKNYGGEKIILGADVKNRRIAIHGWEDESEYELFQFLEEYIHQGVSQTICTDVSKDGMLQGPAFELYRDIKAKFPDLYTVASGGISNSDDVFRLNDDGIDAVIIGKALYEGRIRLADLKGFLC